MSHDKVPLMAVDLVNRAKSRSRQEKSPRTYKTLKKLVGIFEQHKLNNVNGLMKFIDLYQKENSG